MLTRAAKRFDAAFVDVPRETRDRLALAVYRFWPAMRQYQHDVEVLATDKQFRDACWDVAIAVAFRLVRKGQKFAEFSTKEAGELRGAMPRSLAWAKVVAAACDGTLLPGQAAPAPQITEGKKT